MMFLLIGTFGCMSGDSCVGGEMHHAVSLSAASLQRILPKLRENRAFSVCCLLPSAVGQVQKT